MTRKFKKYAYIGATIVLATPFILIGVIYITTAFSQTRPRENAVQPLPNVENRFISEPEWKELVSHRTLASESEAIVTGTTIENKCVSSGDSYHLKTRYKFRIDRVIRGNYKTGDIIYVSLPGGLAPNGSGRMLHVISSGYIKMFQNKQHLLFLKPYITNELTPTRGPQGVFELSGTRLKPFSTYIDGDPKNDDQTLELADVIGGLE